jgi:hypothetical protein
MGKKGVSMPRKRNNRQGSLGSPEEVMVSKFSEGDFRESSHRQGRQKVGARSYSSDISRPFTKSQMPQRGMITPEVSYPGYSGNRRFTDYPFSEHVVPLDIAVHTRFPFVNWDLVTNNSGSDTPTSPAIGRFQQALQQQYIDIVQYTQDKRFIANLLPTNFPISWITWLNAVSNAYCTLRAFQSILETPGLNIAFAAIKQAVEQFRIRIESNLDIVLNYPLPREIYATLDNLCGTFIREEHCAIKVQMPGAAVTAPLIPPSGPPIGADFDLTVAADITTILTNVEAVLAVLNHPFMGSNDMILITEAMRLAYPTMTLPKKVFSQECWMYDNIRFEAIYNNGIGNAPNADYTVPSTGDATAFPLISEADCEYPPQYFSLLRNAVFGSAVPVTDYQMGLVQDNYQNQGTAGFAYAYDLSQKVAMTPSMAAFPVLVGAAVYKDPFLFEYPWEFLTAIAGGLTDYTHISSLVDNKVLPIANIDNLVEESIYGIKTMFATGLR